MNGHFKLGELTGGSWPKYFCQTLATFCARYSPEMSPTARTESRLLGESVGSVEVMQELRQPLEKDRNVEYH